MILLSSLAPQKNGGGIFRVLKYNLTEAELNNVDHGGDGSKVI